jgi:hypothetical protein
MSEYAESFEDDDLLLDEDEFGLEDDDEEDQVAAISEEIDRWEQEAGLTLSDSDFELMGLQIGAYGVTPEAAFERTDAGRKVNNFGDFVSRIEQGEQRTLTRSELERLASLEAKAELTGEDNIDASEALHNLDSSDGRANFIAERMAVPQERDEPSANVLDPATGEETPGFNLDKSNERAAAIDALMAGEDVAGYDSTYEATDEGAE